jgi:nucleotide-binding universal stress UspA family protein
VSTRTYHPVVRGHHACGRIVVGVDGSEGSKAALRWAARQATLTGACLDVVMTWEVPVLPYGVWAGYDASGQAQETLDATVEEILGSSKPDHLVATVIEGRPECALLEAAKKADLLVVGCRGHGLFGGLLLGSVSQRCATHASCPVVVVPRMSIGRASSSTASSPPRPSMA